MNFKMLLDVHKEYNQFLKDEEGARDDDWFVDVDTKVCFFKRKCIIGWRKLLREPNHQGVHPGTAGMYLPREVWTRRNLKIDRSQRVQRYKERPIQQTKER